MSKRVLNEYQFRTHPVGFDPTHPDYKPDTWVTDIVHVGPVIDTSLPQGGRRVGFLEWEKTNGAPASEILMVEVDPEHRRKGLATEAYRRSQEVALASEGRIPIPIHSSWRTDEGDAWAKSIGDRLPSRIR